MAMENKKIWISSAGDDSSSFWAQKIQEAASRLGQSVEETVYAVNHMGQVFGACSYAAGACSYAEGIKNEYTPPAYEEPKEEYTDMMAATESSVKEPPFRGYDLTEVYSDVAFDWEKVEAATQPIDTLAETKEAVDKAAAPSTHTQTVTTTNRFDTFENWLKSSYIPLPGEICIAHDTVMDMMILKVGDGKRKFMALPDIQ